MIKLSYNIKEYRKQLLDTIKEGDTIIELGCHVGRTSEIILKALDSCQLISLDNSPEAVGEMGKIADENDNLKFISGDVRLHDKIKEVYRLTQKCDVLSIDLGGGYHPDTVFKVFYIWSSTFKPKETLIRNKGLIDFCNSTEKSDEKYQSKNGYLESCEDGGIPPQIKEFELWTPELKY